VVAIDAVVSVVPWLQQSWSLAKAVPANAAEPPTASAAVATATATHGRACGSSFVSVNVQVGGLIGLGTTVDN